MKTRSLALVLFLCLTALAPAFAAGKHKGNASIPVHETVISSVTDSSIVIASDKVPKTYAVTQFTEVTLNGQKAALADLKPGMKVSVTMSDPTRLSRIAATTK
jgi:hypothetical protein